MDPHNKLSTLGVVHFQILLFSDITKCNGQMSLMPYTSSFNSLRAILHFTHLLISRQLTPFLVILKLTIPCQGLFYSALASHSQGQAFSDADWASCPKTQKSTTGVRLGYGSLFLAFKEKIGLCAMTTLARELTQLHHLFHDLHLNLSGSTGLGSTVLYCENHATMHIPTNPTFMNASNILTLIVIMFEIKIL